MAFKHTLYAQETLTISVMLCMKLSLNVRDSSYRELSVREQVEVNLQNHFFYGVPAFIYLGCACSFPWAPLMNLLIRDQRSKQTQAYHLPTEIGPLINKFHHFTDGSIVKEKYVRQLSSFDDKTIESVQSVQLTLNLVGNDTLKLYS